MTESTAVQPFDLPADSLISLFEAGDYEVEGRMPNSSNATLLVTVRFDGAEAKAIYKPGQGERPLHDFPAGLYRREVAMFRLSDALGWSVIPPTALVEGPFGEGSVQAFVNADFEEHYFTLLEDGIGIEDLQRLCLLDLIANNTDRKAGHCLLADDGHIYGIDHGLAFHQQWKLRTVMWDFVDEPVPDSMLRDVARLVDEGMPEAVSDLLSPLEADAALVRARAVAALSVFPDDDTGGHRYPWPLV